MSLYSAIAYADQLENALARAWHFLGDTSDVAEHNIVPITLLPQALDEPLLLVRDGDNETCLSNVCTHRGAILCDRASTATTMRCPYHGRRFGLDGRLLSAPGFDGTPGFPHEWDALPQVIMGSMGPLRFVSLAQCVTFERLIDPIVHRLAHLDLHALVPDPAATREYTIDAHWALWCDNYLEGLHIPYVHPALSRTLDVERYRVELHPHGSLQIGMAKRGEPAFDLPEAHPDRGERVGGYYFFLHPACALNFYPWGLSLNAVRPAGPERTTIHYREYVWDASLRDRGPGAGLDRVEREDDDVIERVQRGMRARLYRGGRLAPQHEDAVRHFHDLLRAK
jgi:choline monooxygenase